MRARSRVGSIALLALVVACAAGPKSTAVPPSPHEAGATMSGDPRAEIDRLEREIEAARAQMQLAEPGPAEIEGTEAQPMSVSPASQDPTCRPAQTDTCKTSCTLGDSICSNAEKICKLAAELPGDNYAANKCAKANATCQSSRTKCCGCQ